MLPAIHRTLNPRLLSQMAPYDVAGLVDIARRVIQRILNLRLIALNMASCDAASYVCRSNCPPRHQTDFEPSSIELNGIL